MNRIPRLSILLSVLAFALIIGACSGDDETDATHSTVTTDASAAGSTTSAADGSTTTVADSSSGGLASGSSTTAAGSDSSAATTTSPGGSSDTTSPGGDTTTTIAAPTTTTTTTPPPTTLTAVPITTTTFAGPDGPHLDLGGDIYPFTPDECFVFDGIDPVVSGAGTAPDGTPVYILLDINEFRMDIGTDQPDSPTRDFWTAGPGPADELAVTVDNFLVTATAVFVHNDGEVKEGVFRADCS